MSRDNFNKITNKGGIADLTAGSFGANGFDVLDETSPANADVRYYCILALFESQVDCENLNDTQAHLNLPLVAGMQVFGVFKDVSVATGGKVVAYKI